MYKTRKRNRAVDSHWWLIRPSMNELKGFDRVAVRQETAFQPFMAYPMGALALFVPSVGLVAHTQDSAIVPWAELCILSILLAVAAGTILWRNYRHLSYYRKMEREGRVISLDHGIGKVFREEILFPRGTDRYIEEPLQWELLSDPKVPRTVYNAILRPERNRLLLVALAEARPTSAEARQLLTDELTRRAEGVLDNTFFKGGLRHAREKMESQAAALEKRQSELSIQWAAEDLAKARLLAG